MSSDKIETNFDYDNERIEPSQIKTNLAEPRTSDENSLEILNLSNVEDEEVVMNNDKKNELLQLFVNGPMEILKENNSLSFIDIKSNVLFKFINDYRKPYIDVNDPRLEYWLEKVAPSCVYPQRVLENNYIYRCCVPNCGVQLKSQKTLIRHYKEQHISMLPTNIFGRSILHACEPCGYFFKRYEHLLAHKTSDAHHQRMAFSGDLNSQKIIDAHTKMTEENKKQSKRKLADCSDESNDEVFVSGPSTKQSKLEKEANNEVEKFSGRKSFKDHLKNSPRSLNSKKVKSETKMIKSLSDSFISKLKFN